MNNNILLSIVLLLTVVFIPANATSRLLLNDWVLRIDQGVYPAYIPSTIIDLLIKNTVLPNDFYYRDNFLKAYAYETKDATYTLNFLATKEQLTSKYQTLIFEGLDTHCEVYLNSKLILQSHNMFRRYQIPIQLQKLNNLTVKFYSAANYDLQQQQAFKQAYGFTLPQNYSFSRKASYHYGWDWGPRIASMGIWKEVSLNCYNETRIVNFYLKQLTEITQNSQYIHSQIHIELDQQLENNHYTVQITIYNQKTLTKVFNKNLQINNKQSHFTSIIDWNITQNIQSYIWWIWQLGEQPLFTLEVKVIDQQLKVIHTNKVVQNIGFKTVKLNQSQSQGGKQFTINLNGIDIYSRGGNYIPPQMSLAKTTAQTYKIVVQNAKQQNFNMLRVWGGGHFQKDEFYTQCDKAGILIWHDLMYACALYPYNNQIAQDIEQQMIDNLKRLRHHPSIALWNGNNQVWIGWQQWGWKDNKTQQQKSLIQTMYKGTFQLSIPKVITEITPHIPYWQTSPSVSSNSLSTITSGDIHFWRVWGAGTSIEEYNTFIGRFNSEYGMQSMPDISTIENFTSPQDRQLGSLILRLHERHPKGDEYLPMYVQNNTHSLTKNLTRFSYFSQVMQSYALQLAITSLRGNKPYNMGSLYWQLNDVWPVSSWATIDYLQVKKVAHYKIKQLYDPVHVGIYDSTPQILGNYTLYTVNDYNKRLNCHYTLKVISFTGLVINTTTTQKTLLPLSRSLITKLYMTPQEIADLKKYYTNSFLRIEMNCVEKQSRVYNFFFVKMKNRAIVNPQLTYEYVKETNSVKVSVKNVATYVWVYAYDQVNDRHFAFKNIQDNYFTLLPGQTRTIKLNQSDKQIINKLAVTSYQIQALKEIKSNEYKNKLNKLFSLTKKTHNITQKTH